MGQVINNGSMRVNNDSNDQWLITYTVVNESKPLVPRPKMSMVVENGPSLFTKKMII